MPKDRRVNSLSIHRARVCPYACSSKASNEDKYKSSLPPVGDEKEWEEARCPICMEHPHNAVLLLCSSREKGCRPFMCDTSHRHSNCLDQYKSSAVGSSAGASEDFPVSRGVPYGGREAHSYSRSIRSIGQQPKLVCPLCRGQVTGWVVIESARKFMNSKFRSCSLETCSFSGNYTELRKHARQEHPSVRPTEADPTRQNEWRRLERQRDIEDTLSAYQAFGDDMNEDLLDDFPLGGSLFDFLSGVHSGAEDEWSDEDNMSPDIEFELDFSFLSDIFFSTPMMAMDFSWPATGGRFHNQRPNRSRARSSSMPRSDFDRRRNARAPGATRNTNSATRNTNSSSGRSHGSWDSS